MSLFVGLGTLGVFAVLYRFIGVPVGGTAGEPNFLLLGMGALFCGSSATGFTNPTGITGGNTDGSQLTPQQWTNSHSLSESGGYIWAVLMLVAGLTLSALGLFAGTILG